MSVRITLATNIPRASETRAEFARDSGLAQFCEESGEAIRDLIGREKPWELLRADGFPNERASIIQAYAADLPIYCPHVLNTDKLREVVLQQFVLRLRLRMPLVDRPTIHVRSTSVFTDSIDYLNGPGDILVAGRLSVHLIGEEGMDVGVSVDIE